MSDERSSRPVLKQIHASKSQDHRDIITLYTLKINFLPKDPYTLAMKDIAVGERGVLDTLSALPGRHIRMPTKSSTLEASPKYLPRNSTVFNYFSLHRQPNILQIRFQEAMAALLRGTGFITGAASGTFYTTRFLNKLPLSVSNLPAKASAKPRRFPSSSME